jgi:acyl transferase domain-containing protein
MRLVLAALVLAVAGCGGTEATQPPAFGAALSEATAVCVAGAFRCNGSAAEVCTDGGWLVVKDCATRPHAAGLPLSCFECGAVVPSCAPSPDLRWCG